MSNTPRRSFTDGNSFFPSAKKYDKRVVIPLDKLYKDGQRSKIRASPPGLINVLPTLIQGYWVFSIKVTLFY